MNKKNELCIWGEVREFTHIGAMKFWHPLWQG